MGHVIEHTDPSLLTNLPIHLLLSHSCTTISSTASLFLTNNIWNLNTVSYQEIAKVGLQVRRLNVLTRATTRWPHTNHRLHAFLLPPTQSESDTRSSQQRQEHKAHGRCSRFIPTSSSGKPSFSAIHSTSFPHSLPTSRSNIPIQAVTTARHRNCGNKTTSTTPRNVHIVRPEVTDRRHNGCCISYRRLPDLPRPTLQDRKPRYRPQQLNHHSMGIDLATRALQEGLPCRVPQDLGPRPNWRRKGYNLP